MTNIFLWGDSWSHPFLKASHPVFGAPEGIEGRYFSNDPSQRDSHFSVCKGWCGHLICLSWQALELPNFGILLLSAITFKCLGLGGSVELALISSLRAAFSSVPGDSPGAKQCTCWRCLLRRDASHACFVQACEHHALHCVVLAALCLLGERPV